MSACPVEKLVEFFSIAGFGMAHSGDDDVLVYVSSGGTTVKSREDVSVELWSAIGISIVGDDFG